MLVRSAYSPEHPVISQLSQETPTATWGEGRPCSHRESAPHSSAPRLADPPRVCRARTALFDRCRGQDIVSDASGA
jgi:hypothetical protein